MRLSRRSEYGLRALTDLVRSGPSATVPLGTLARRNNLPPKFLEQIMATLTAASSDDAGWRGGSDGRRPGGLAGSGSGCSMGVAPSSA
jgi:hypothetical protein